MTDNTNEPLDLDAIEKRAEAATPGPWKWDDRQPLTLVGGPRYEWNTSDDVVYVEHIDGGGYSPCSTEVDMEPGDAAFIAHARSDIPALLARVKEQDIENFALRSVNAQGQRNVDELIERVRSLQGELRRMDEKNAKMASALKPFAALGFPDGALTANISLMGSWVAAAREALRRDGK